MALEQPWSILSLCDTDSTGPDRAKERKGALMQTCVCVRQGIPLNPSGLSPAPCSCMASKGAAMASFHLAVKTIGRSAGRSATAAAAYRAGVEITDERTGLVHDYTRKQGVEHNALVVPADAPAWASDRAVLWNAAEQAETRKNSTVAREYEIALPAELSAEARRELALGLAREISERHGVAVDVAIHAPGRECDHRNHHAHLLTTTRRIGPEGRGAKTRELDQKTSGVGAGWGGEARREAALGLAWERSEGPGVAVDGAIHAAGREVDHRNHHAHRLTTTRRIGPEGLGAKTRELDHKTSGEVERWRGRWAEMQNAALERANVPERVDHRSHQRRGIEQEATVHMGPSATAMERRAERQAMREGDRKSTRLNSSH